MSDYKSFQPSILPANLQGPNGLAYAGVLGGLKDIISNDARAAAVVGMPNALQPDALPAIGYERQLPRGPSESDAQYAERLRTAWDAWKLAGTPLAILLQLEILYPGIPIVIVQQAVRAFSLNPDRTLPAIDRLVIYVLPGGGWTFDNNGGLPLSEGLWSRFGLLFPGPLPPAWSPVAPPTSMTNPSLNEVNQITEIVLKWKAAKATYMGIQVRVSGIIWDWPTTQDWNDAGLVWDGVAVRYLPTLY